MCTLFTVDPLNICLRVGASQKYQKEEKKKITAFILSAVCYITFSKVGEPVGCLTRASGQDEQIVNPGTRMLTSTSNFMVPGSRDE